MNVVFDGSVRASRRLPSLSRRSFPGWLVGLCFLLSPPSFAYRTDHGFLPPGASACEAHIPVTLDLTTASQPMPDPFRGEFSGGFFHVGEIAPDLFYMTDGGHQAVFLVSEQGIIVVDAPPSIGFNPFNPANSVSILDVIYSIPETQGKDIKKLIYSHSHLDHIGAASIIHDEFPNVQIIAHVETHAQIQRGTGRSSLLPNSGTLPPPLPNAVFTDSTSVALGQNRLELSYLGPAHEPGNIFIYAPSQKVLILVDVITPGAAPFVDLSLAEDVPMFVEAHDRVLEFDFETFIGGHFNRVGDRDDVLLARLYIQDIQANAARALSEPSLLAIFGIVPRNALGAASIFLDQVACRCANLTLDPMSTPSGVNWSEVLAAADINTLGHCATMAESLRIDPSF